ncbi:MAG: DPP IV N-terminal domain-containing protein [Candidatus Moduliflexus flocculans]|nr:DPP IV N-terminal domain-containing protein [Candidatus Moduliflexus flocculans]
MAAALSAASGEKFEALALPFAVLTFSEDGKSLEFGAAGIRWSCDLADLYAPEARGPGSPRPVRLPAVDVGAGPGPRGRLEGVARASPDGKWEASIRNYNLVLREKGTQGGDLPQPRRHRGRLLHLRFASPGRPTRRSSSAYRLTPRLSPRHPVRRVLARRPAPAEVLDAMEYAKPGDVLDLEQPGPLRSSTRRRALEIDNALFPNPYELSGLAWRKDSRAFTFEYNQRGHQVYRVIEVDAATGAARAVIDERAEDLLHLHAGKKYRRDLADGREVVWMSERDGWNHLYLLDGATGARQEPDHEG